MLEVSDLVVSYGPIEVVHSLNLTVDEGEIVAILGRNGAGKSSTLNGIVGVVKPVSGEIVMNGKSLRSSSIGQISRSGVAYVPEGRGVLPGLTVAENLAVAAYGHGQSRRSAKAEIHRAANWFPALESRMKQRAGTMSGGEQQMLVIARALVAKPKLLLVDEPGLGLSPIVVSMLYDLFVKLNREEGLSILLVEQYVGIALRTSRRAYILEKGTAVHEGKCEDLRDADIVSAYVG
jgi:branched-chain amino acid transport system ATP-binding protein